MNIQCDIIIQISKKQCLAFYCLIFSYWLSTMHGDNNIKLKGKLLREINIVRHCYNVHVFMRMLDHVTYQLFVALQATVTFKSKSFNFFFSMLIPELKGFNVAFNEKKVFLYQASSVS